MTLFAVRLCSMTGYAKVVKAGWAIEVRSYNRKHLDVELNVPSLFQPMYLEIKKALEALNHRGKIILSLTPHLLSHCPVRIAPNIEMAAQLLLAWKEIGRSLAIDLDGHLPYLLGQSAHKIMTENQIEEVDETIQVLIFSGIQEALCAHRKKREEEGVELQKDFINRIALAIDTVEKIKLREPFHRDYLEHKIKEKFSHLVVIEENLKKELAFLMDKSDIQEEITRLMAHIHQLSNLLTQEEMTDGKGKKMEFILQEMLREANTMGAKTADIEMMHRIIELKTEIERMREQVQNVE